MNAKERDLQAVRILIVDDNEMDAEMVRMCLEELPVRMEFATARDGEAACAYLRAAARADELPDLILLDIWMPRMDGHETLQWIRSQPEFKHVPVVMLTTSDAEHDVRKAYEGHANGYLLKSQRLEGLRDMAAALGSFWLTAVRLPTTQATGATSLPSAPFGCATRVLYVERDDARDSDAIRAAMREAGFVLPAVFLPERDTMSDCLQYPAAAPPDLILVDSARPEAVLEHLDRHPPLSSIPRVVLTDHEHHGIAAAQPAAVTAILPRPENSDERSGVFRALAHWCAINRFTADS